MTVPFSPESLNAITTGMGAICGALALQMPPDAVRGFERDLRRMALARKNAGDTIGQMLVEDLAASVVAMRPELFGH